MSNKFLEPGKIMTYTAPAGGVTVDVPLILGGMFVVPLASAAVGVTFEGATEGMWTLTKLAGEGALVEGQPVYWDVANLRFSIDHTVGLPIGTMAASALTGDTAGAVRLHGLSLAGRNLVIRKRFTIAQVNAGATLLPALPGIKYRLVDAWAIAVGGAMTSNTTADLKGTQASSVVKLVAYAQASMTQSALVRAGAAGAAILADGASFAQCDVNTAVTVGNTGAAITVSTFVDYTAIYTLE